MGNDRLIGPGPWMTQDEFDRMVAHTAAQQARQDFHAAEDPMSEVRRLQQEVAALRARAEGAEALLRFVSAHAEAVRAQGGSTTTRGMLWQIDMRRDGPCEPRTDIPLSLLGQAREALAEETGRQIAPHDAAGKEASVDE